MSIKIVQLAKELLAATIAERTTPGTVFGALLEPLIGDAPHFVTLAHLENTKTGPGLVVIIVPLADGQV